MGARQSSLLWRVVLRALWVTGAERAAGVEPQPDEELAARAPSASEAMGKPAISKASRPSALRSLPANATELTGRAPASQAWAKSSKPCWPTWQDGWLESRSLSGEGI